MADSPLFSSSTRGQLIDPWPIDGTQFDYVNVDAFFAQLRSIGTSFTDEQRANGPWILVTSVDEQAFKCIQDSHHELLDLWSILYNPVDYTISTKMESFFHGTLAMAITRWLDGKLTTMGLNHEAIFTGTANHTLFVLNRAGQRVLNDVGNPEIIRKRADQTVHPFTVQAPRSMKWPSLVLEVSYSESRAKIGEDLRLWLQNSQSEIRFAMAAFITARSKTISIEEWKVRTRAGTQEQPRYTAERIQFMSIEKPRSHGDPIITGSFTVPFDRLLLRQPTAGETDFDMSQKDLRQIAAQVWRSQSIGDAWRQ
ncbi:hypothetical protein N7509_005797 [Penicillium cosmopolitanum]|uniref:Uncharacterized protein n=1 Tax=Penicillium cosmopolitanum TaxID=1131564 RepID=A0A9X0BAF3_9EURO|nr:uncharacterized protein N7509_005797 [Penicillium cosmopolitanum]KAJ5397684.1 hypothetical protein N7509_005797 [Penicillium cosmopolitanum]